MNSKELNQFDRESKKLIDSIIEINNYNKENELLEKLKAYCAAFNQPKKRPVINEAIRQIKSEYFYKNNNEIEKKDIQKRIKIFTEFINKLNENEENTEIIIEMIG